MTLGLEAGSSGRPAAHPPPQGCVGTVWGRRGPAPREGRPDRTRSQSPGPTPLPAGNEDRTRLRKPASRRGAWPSEQRGRLPAPVWAGGPLRVLGAGGFLVWLLALGTHRPA